MYVCGPTVYDVPHVGHGRTAVVYDVIRRYLEWRGNVVTFVGNVTNVEDKIIARAASEGTSERELADRYEQAYWDELDRLDVRRPDDVPRATEFIEPMVDLIRELVDSGHAYVIEGEGVYFSVASYTGYGELSGRRLDDLVEGAGARVEVDEQKRSPVDFALWKAAKPGEPDWDSPWGRGRPGWHIECSAMSLVDPRRGLRPPRWRRRPRVPAPRERARPGRGRRSRVRHPLDPLGDGDGRAARRWRSRSATSPRSATRSTGTARPHSASRCSRSTTAARWSSPPRSWARRPRAIQRVENLRRRAARDGVTPAPPTRRAGGVHGRDGRRLRHARRRSPPIFDAVRGANAALDAGRHRRGRGQARGGGGAARRPRVRAPRRPRRPTTTTRSTPSCASGSRPRAARDFATADRIRDELAERGVTIEDSAVRHAPGTADVAARSKGTGNSGRDRPEPERQRRRAVRERPDASATGPSERTDRTISVANRSRVPRRARAAAGAVDARVREVLDRRARGRMPTRSQRSPPRPALGCASSARCSSRSARAPRRPRA